MFWGSRFRARAGAARLGLAAAALAACLAAPAAAVADQATCTDPTSGDWQHAKPADLGLNGARLTEALGFGDSRLSSSVLLIRHGCMAGISPAGQANYYSPGQSFSMAKSTVAMAAMRAMTMGLLSPDDRVGALMPEADAAHGAITVRQLLEMNSGLHWNLLADYGNVFNPDIVHSALMLPIDHKPGTFFEYHQAAVVLLAKVIERAVGQPFQDFVQDELFTPIGIQRSQWTWDRDNVGDTRGFWGLGMPAQAFARLGELMLREGTWNGRRLIDPWYVAQAHAKSATNPGYGWLFWRNDPDGYIGATIMARRVLNHPDMPAVPMDGYEMSGLLDQQVVIIPSLDTVYVRLGLPESDVTASADFVTFLSSSEGTYTQSRKLMGAFEDPDVPDHGPWVDDPPVVAKPGEPGLADSLNHFDELLASISEYKPPLPPAGPRLARVPVIPSGLVRVDAGGAASVPVSCPAAAAVTCSDRFLLMTAEGRPLSLPAVADIAPGQSATVRFKVLKAARDRIVGAPVGTLAARVSVYGTDAGGRWRSMAMPPVALTVQPQTS